MDQGMEFVYCSECNSGSASALEYHRYPGTSLAVILGLVS